MKRLYSLTDRIPFEYGGRTKAILLRMDALDQDYDNILLSTEYLCYYHQVTEKMMKNDHLRRPEQHINFFQQVAPSCGVQNNAQQWVAECQKRFATKVKTKKMDIYYTAEGIPGVEAIKEDGKIVRFRIYDRFGMYIQAVYLVNDLGNIEVVRYYDGIHSLFYRQAFVDGQGNIRLTFDYIHLDEKKDHKICHVIEKLPQQEEHHFPTKAVWQKAVLERIVTAEDEIICDTRVQDPLVFGLACPKVYVLHNSHRKNQADVKSIKKRFDRLFTHVQKADGQIVVLSQGQYQDIVDLYPGLKNKMHIISHYTNFHYLTAAPAQVQPYFLIAARFHPQKRIEEAIYAFHQVSKQLPSYTLRIYGDGEEKEHLLDLVQNLGNSNIKVEDFSTQVNALMYEATAYLCTSQYEGFSLSLNEALSNGCPVVSYDIPYGPKDIIQEGKNGFLVENNNRQAFGEALLEVARLNEDGQFDRKQMMLEHQQRYGKESYYQKWLAVLAAAQKEV